MPSVSAATLAFTRQHWDDDPLPLLLQQRRYPDVDMRMAAQQIEGRQQARLKWPTLYACEEVLYPPKLNREQSSSETAARYKASLTDRLSTRPVVADITGGMGIDSMMFARNAASVDYVEQDATLADTAAHNFSTLGVTNIRCHCADGMAWLHKNERHYDIIYIDPSRRDSNGHRMQAFEDCTPNLLEHLDFLLGRCSLLIVKASPMTDITTATAQLRTIRETHIVAVEGECKEVVFLVDATGQQPAPIHCVDILADHTYHNTFTRESETAATTRYASTIDRYLYEPNAAIMKGGAFHSIGDWYDVAQLGHATHLYTSPQLIAHFPGRIFEVISQVSLNVKEVRRILPDSRCHLLCKNYPVSTAVLRKQLRLEEGGDCHLIATRIGKTPTGVLCRRVAPTGNTIA